MSRVFHAKGLRKIEYKIQWREAVVRQNTGREIKTSLLSRDS